MKNKSLDVFVGTKGAQAIKFKAIDFLADMASKEFSNKTFIKLKKGDELITRFLYYEQKGDMILFITSKGFGIRFKLSDIRFMGAGGPGVKFTKLTSETGVIIKILLLRKEKVLRIKTTDFEKGYTWELNDIPILPRGSQGVKIIKLEKEEKITDITIK